MSPRAPGGMGSGAPSSVGGSGGGGTGATVVVEGNFEGRQQHDTAGGYKMERAPGDLPLVLDDRFETDQGPDL
ncbi:MAG: hypothetical protein ABEL97_09625 [Salinibacter sp.]